MSPSPLDAAQQAFDLTRRRLFPFKFERWLALGFVAFLDQCGRTQSGFPGRLGSGVGEEVEERGGAGPVLNDVAAWLAAHVMLVMAVAAVVLVLILCFTALVLWINSRGVFMYVDNVATGRADVGRPWREHRPRADSYFAWSFGFTMVALTGGLMLLVTAAFVIFRLARGEGGLGLGVTALVVLGALFLIFVLAAALASLALRDFVAPIQLKTGLSCGASFGIFLGLLRLYPGAFVVYVIFKIVFALVLAFAVMLAACVTCCCALIPVVTQTVLQPAFYFERAWSLCLLRPLGYDLIVPPAPAAPPAPPAPAAPPPPLPSSPREEPPHVPDAG